MKRTRVKNKENYNNVYIHGNTVRKFEPQKYNDVEKIKLVKNERSKSVRPQYIPIGQVVVISFLLIMFFGMCVSRLHLQAQATASIKKIGQMNVQYNELKNENDAEYTRLSTKRNLLEIREVAINELGMVYPKKEQVIFVDPQNVNWVTQYREVPEE